jgi:GNAT superfamily N-acetyltransferase
MTEREYIAIQASWRNILNDPMSTKEQKAVGGSQEARLLMQIKVVERNDPLVQRAKALIEREAMLSWVLLFEGDRWHYVECCAVALNDEGQPVGLASLSPTDEMGAGGPNVIGLWVSPPYRRQGTGLALVARLAQESWERYGRGAPMLAITKAAVGLANILYQENVPIDCKNAGFGDLP